MFQSNALDGGGDNRRKSSMARWKNGSDRANGGRRFALCLITSALISLPVFSQSSQPVSPATMTAATRGVPGFEDELKLAHAARDRDGKIRHLRSAVALRPGNAQNIVLEFEIAKLTCTTNDPAHGQSANPRAGVALFEDIVKKYDHRLYYQSAPGDDYSPEMMVPRAAIQAAAFLRFLFQENGKSREYARIAMNDVAWTYQKRKAEWESAPRPATNPTDLVDVRIKEQFDYDVANWEDRKRDAATGNIMGAGQSVANAAVIEFGLSFGPQHPGDVPAVMQHIIDDYPDTPMAVVAREHIKKAQAFALATTGRIPATTKATNNQADKRQQNPQPNPPQPQRPLYPIIIYCIALCVAGGIAAFIVMNWVRKRSKSRQ